MFALWEAPRKVADQTDPFGSWVYGIKLPPTPGKLPPLLHKNQVLAGHLFYPNVNALTSTSSNTKVYDGLLGYYKTLFITFIFLKQSDMLFN